jgi:hypothetical protein
MIASLNAWFGKGHLMVARVAYDILERDSPEKLK